MGTNEIKKKPKNKKLQEKERENLKKSVTHDE